MRCFGRNLSQAVIAFMALFLFTTQLQAQTFTWERSFGGYIDALNENGEYLYRVPSGGSALYLPDSAYGLPPGPKRLFGPDGENPGALSILNDLGVVVGEARGLDGVSRLTLWVAGEPHAIDPTDSLFTRATDMNNLGHIIGHTRRFTSPPPLTQVPFFYDGSQFLNLDPMEYDTCHSGFAAASAINNSDAIVGVWACAAERFGTVSLDYYIWQGTSASKIQNPDFISVTDINDSGQALGNMRTTNLLAILDNGSLTILPQLNDTGVFSAFGPKLINNRGQVVGSSRIGTKTVVFLWLPEPDYGLAAGIYDLNELVDLPSLRIQVASGFNSSGQIAVEARNDATGRFSNLILSPAGPPPQTGIVVNSFGDDSDANPGDTICATSDGDCTMRAAIEESNALAQMDTIKFQLPGGEIPVIRPSAELPAITNPVVIDGSTQPNSAMVELSGMFVDTLLEEVSGLTIKSGSCEISNLLINNFSGNGITIDGSSDNFIRNNVIGASRDLTESRGNGGHGILIRNSSDNRIGESRFANPRTNFITNNSGAGVFVESGIGNLIEANSIFSNGGLGIDLAPEGLNPNDSLDGDVGANALTNRPIMLDAAILSSSVFVRALLWGEPNQSYNLGFYASAECDPSNFGEGQIFLGSSLKTADANGRISLFDSYDFITVSENSFITATATIASATESNNSTSEFSSCWPNKKLKVVDANGAIIAGQSFALSRISNNAPLHSDTLIDTIVTDVDGFIDLTEFYRDDKLSYDDTIQLSKLLHTEPTVKHPTEVAEAYRVELDNAKFDTLGVMSFDILDETQTQTIVLDHTTLIFSLLVSIEWDAKLEYMESLKEGFRGMSNYMYDVSDGQIRFDTIAIFDDKDEWNFADMQIYADNTLWPHVDKVNGINRAFGDAADPIEMPRKWFGDELSSRNGSFNEYPLDLTVSGSYRTIAHEFAHYALGFFDEYVFAAGSVRCADREDYVRAYGFMDCQYDNCGVYGSELSGAAAYTDTLCQNNAQWIGLNQSTWQTLEAVFEKDYNGILAPIIKPSERELAMDFDYLKGPNDDIANLEFDAGALVEFPIEHAESQAGFLKVRFFSEADPNSEVKVNIRVVLVDPLASGPERDIDQGKVSEDGGVWVIGKKPFHEIGGSGYSQILAASLNRGTSGQAGAGRTWLYLSSISEFADSAMIGFKEVQGDKSLISQIQLASSGFNYSIETDAPFASDPEIEHQPEGDSATNHMFAPDANGYNVAIADSLSAQGSFLLSVVDDSSVNYSFNADYTTQFIDSHAVVGFKGPRGVSEARIDNSSNSIERALLLSTNYPVLRNGIDPQSLQAGAAQNLAVYPQVALTGDNNSITIRYSDLDLSVASGTFAQEENLRIFRWIDKTTGWQLVGGQVDTFYNEVKVAISESGVYAAFTTDIQTDVNDNETGSVLPKQFELYQNYPNPFNPSTKITFSLPTASQVKLEIYNILGQKVTTLYEGRLGAGVHSYEWDGRTAASGVYLYRLTAGDYAESRKMMLLK